VVGSVAGGGGPFKVGDRIVGVGKREVKTEAQFAMRSASEPAFRR